MVFQEYHKIQILRTLCWHVGRRMTAKWQINIRATPTVTVWQYIINSLINYIYSFVLTLKTVDVFFRVQLSFYSIYFSFKSLFKLFREPAHEWASKHKTQRDQRSLKYILRASITHGRIEPHWDSIIAPSGALSNLNRVMCCSIDPATHAARVARARPNIELSAIMSDVIFR